MSGDEVNPYAAHRAALEAPPDQGQDLWRDGNEILVCRRDAIFPGRCIKCNEAADPPPVRYKLTWHHPGWYVLVFVYLLIYLVVALLVRKRAQIYVGFVRHTGNANSGRASSAGADWSCHHRLGLPRARRIRSRMAGVGRPGRHFAVGDHCHCAVRRSCLRVASTRRPSGSKAAARIFSPTCRNIPARQWFNPPRSPRPAAVDPDAAQPWGFGLTSVVNRPTRRCVLSPAPSA